MKKLPPKKVWIQTPGGCFYVSAARAKKARNQNYHLVAKEFGGKHC